jgi:hypothetical protein
MSLQLVPVKWQDVQGFVEMWHRHHKPPVGYLWGHGVAADSILVGSHRNANSMLYAAVVRAAFAKGYRRVVTYTQDGEQGSSLKAAGFRIIAQLPPRKGWDTPSRPRTDRGVDGIPRTLWDVTL